MSEPKLKKHNDHAMAHINEMQYDLELFVSKWINLPCVDTEWIESALIGMLVGMYACAEMPNAARAGVERLIKTLQGNLASPEFFEPTPEQKREGRSKLINAWAKAHVIRDIDQVLEGGPAPTKH